MQALPTQAPVHNLSLLARQIVEGFLIGLHKSPFHGFSVEFAEHRQYNSGDNLKYVDWKAYGRSDKMYIKKFEEETNLRCCLAIDTSNSMNYRSDGLSKLEYAAIIASSFTYLMKKQMDACSLALFDEKLYHLIPARTGAVQTRLIIAELETLLKENQEKTGTNLAKSLHELAERIQKRSLVIIFSDVPEDPSNLKELIAALQHLKYNKHEVLFFHILNEDKELNLNFENRPYTFEDMETGQTIQLNPEEYKSVFLEKSAEYREQIKDECLKHQIDYVYCDTKQNAELLLTEFLTKRNKMM